jgi:tetratricopeptide (TPR) repeat protein
MPLQNYVPNSEHGTIFITSRNRDFCFLTSPDLHWELGPMADDEALDALMLSAQRTKTLTVDDLQEGAILVDRLGCLALAIIQAGSYCFQKTTIVNGIETPFTFRQYLDEMTTNHTDLMRYPAVQSLDQYGKSVYQSLNMSYSALPPLTRDFLHLCGFFHHTNIPVLMFESAVDRNFEQSCKYDPEERTNSSFERELASLLSAPGKSTTIHLHKIIFSLKMYSLVVTSMTPNSVTLNFHALVNTWSRDLLSAQDRAHYSILATRVLSTSCHIKAYQVHNCLSQHIHNILRHCRVFDINDLGAFADRLSQDGLWWESERLFRMMYDICVTRFGKDNRKTLMVGGNLATSIMEQGRLEESMALRRVVMESAKQLPVQEGLLVFETELNFAACLLREEKWDEAGVRLVKLLEIAKRVFGRADPKTLGTMSNYAASLDNNGRRQEAMEMREEVFKLAKEAFGAEHPTTLRAMVSLASSYKQFDRYEEAKRLEEEALDLMRRTNGKEHPDTMAAMNNLANTYKSMGKLVEAAIVGEECLATRAKIIGIKHPFTMKTMLILAKIYFDMDRMNDGMGLLEKLRELEGGEGNLSMDLAAYLREMYW